MTQPASQALSQFPNLFELIGRQGGLAGYESWCGPAIGIDEVADGIPAPAIGSDEQVNQFVAIGSDESDGAPAVDSDELRVGGVDTSSDADENILQDEIGIHPLNAMSVSGSEVIGEDEAGGPVSAPELQATSICSDETIGQDELDLSPASLDRTSICTDEAIGQDEVTSPPAPKLDTMSICSDEAIGQDEFPPGATLQLDRMSICSDENFLEDEVAESDSRLKTDIAQVGTTAHGLPLYNFRYIGGTEVYEGVMAQDVLKVMPSAVLRGADGYYRVKYKDLGVQMRRVA